MSITLHPGVALHPGEWLRAEFVEPHGLSITAAADRLGVTRQAMSTLLNARAGLSADMAMRFEGAFGVERRHADADAGRTRLGRRAGEERAGREGGGLTQSA